jgi:hypothetical protein
VPSCVGVAATSGLRLSGVVQMQRESRRGSTGRDRGWARRAAAPGAQMGEMGRVIPGNGIGDALQMLVGTVRTVIDAIEDWGYFAIPPRNAVPWRTRRLMR